MIYMILVRYLSTTESLISLSGIIPLGPVALFTLSDLTILFISSLDARGNSKSLAKRFLLWLQHWDDFCKFKDFFYGSSILTLEIRIAN